MKTFKENNLEDRDKMEQWLIFKISSLQKIAADVIDINRNFKYYNISSFELISLTEELNKEMQSDFPSTICFDYPNIKALVNYIFCNKGEYEPISLKKEPEGNEKGLSRKNQESINIFYADSGEDNKNDSVAVIGYDCRFPGKCNSPEEFWNFLKQGGDAITEVPSQRWDIDQYYHKDPDKPGKMNTRWGGFLDGVDLFDYSFFGISPREAVCIDPQQRIALEVSWKALENAGEMSSQLNGSNTGVFIGISGSDYGRMIFDNPDSLNLYCGTGNSSSITPNRISFALGLRGPSLAIDTACSSSLVAIHQACRSLLADDCDMALAGGVNLILSPEMTIIFSKAKLMAPDGRCKTFDAEANGYVRSEGCGMVVLKRLDDAIQDNNTILGIIRRSEINQDGQSNGITVPNGLAQEALLRKTLSRAGIHSSEIDYIETHGTGTFIGDPIEVGAIGKVFQGDLLRKKHLILGSVKTNIGHLEQAAGIAGLIKILLMFKHKEIPRHLHLTKINPQISLNEIPAVIPLEAMSWESNGNPRKAGINGFSFGGVNAHLILEEPPDLKLTDNDLHRPLHLVTLSAVNEDILKDSIKRLKEHIKRNEEINPGDIGVSMNAGRIHQPVRVAFIADTLSKLETQLELLENNQKPQGVIRNNLSGDIFARIAFLFTGQGSQYLSMAETLYRTQPTFASVLNYCNDKLEKYLEHNILTVILGNNKKQYLLNETKYTQPVLFALEYSLARLWDSWGIKPDIMLGHSVGEYVAACLAGVFKLDDALRLIAKRGSFMNALPCNGAMVVVQADESTTARLISPFPNISIAAVNSKHNTVVSGEKESVEKFEVVLKKRDIQSIPLQVSHAFHSSLMEPVLDDYKQVLDEIEFSYPRISIISNVTGELVDNDYFCSPGYWLDHIVKPVRFLDSMRILSGKKIKNIIEIGPHPVLCNISREIVNDDSVRFYPSLRKGHEDWKVMLESLASLYVNGVDINWRGFDMDYQHKKIPLPATVLENKRCWITKGRKKKSQTCVAGEFHPSGGRRVSVPYKDYIFEYTCSAHSPFLDHHRVHGYAVMSGSTFISMVISSLKNYYNNVSFHFTNTVIASALHVPDNQEVLIHLVIKPLSSDVFKFQIFSRHLPASENEQWKEHGGGSVLLKKIQKQNQQVNKEIIASANMRCTDVMSGEEFYKPIYDAGLQLKRAFRWLESIRRTDGEAVALMRLPGNNDEEFPPGQIHSGLIDSCTQLLFACVSSQEDTAYMFFGYDSLIFYPGAGERVWCYIKLTGGDNSSDSLTGNFILLTEEGKIAAEATGVHVKRASQDALLKGIGKADERLYYKTVWKKVNRQPEPEESKLPENRKFLIFTGGPDACSTLGEILQSRNIAPLFVLPSSQYKKESNSLYYINPEDESDYKKLFSSEMKENAEQPLTLLYWLGFPFSSENPEIVPPVEKIIQNTISAFYLIRNLFSIKTSSLPEIIIISRGLQRLYDNQKSFNLLDAPLLGLQKALSNEAADLNIRIIDVAPGHQETIASVDLFEEIDHGRESLVALIDDVRYLPVLKYYTQKMEFPAGVNIKGDATYMITGGTGGLGLLLLKWLVGKGARHLVLVSRNGPSGNVEEALKIFSDTGVRIFLPRADVGKKEQLSAVFDDVCRNMPPVRGVFHLSGIVDDGMISGLSGQQFVNVMEPKISGALNLHHLTAHLEIDYFVLFSSVVSLLGRPGQANYAAANAGLDLFAHYRRSRGLPCLSIQWGPWNRIGMMSSLDARGGEKWLDDGFRLFSEEQGMFLFDHVLTESENCELAVFDLDWRKYFDAHPGLTQHSFFEELRKSIELPGNESSAKEIIEPSVLAILANKDNEAQSEIIQEYITVQIREVLWMEKNAKVNEKKPLMELGLDSLMIIELRNRLMKGFNVNIPLTDFLQKPTIEKLTRTLVALFDKREEDQSDVVQLPEIIIRKEDRYKPFPLSDVQYAYWIGRSGNFDLSDISCHVYIEVEMKNLDVHRLNSALTKLTERHEMLRAVVLPDGEQKILNDFVSCQIDVLDVRNFNAAEKDASLLRRREGMSHYKHPSDTGPLFEVAVSLIDVEISRIHISFDLLIGDGWSFNILINDLYAYYLDPAALLPELELSFRDYILAEQKLQETSVYKESLDYWKKKVHDIPPAAQLPFKRQPGELKRTRFSRIASSLDKHEWDILKDKAARAGLTASGVLLAAYAVILGRWSTSDRFTIMLTLLNRLPLHNQVNMIVGDFTSLVALVVDNTRNQSFMEKASAIQEQFWKDMEHRYVSGVRVIRELNKVKREGSSINMPVVFTSVLPYGGNGPRDKETITLGLPSDLPVKPVYCISQTPQVWLDFQIFEHRGDLIFHWDVVQEIFPEGLLQDMFDSLCVLLKELISKDDVWNNRDWELLPLKQKERHDLINNTNGLVCQDLLHTGFVKQVGINPDKTAVVSKGRNLTYRELYQEALSVARILLDNHVQPNTLIGVITEKSWEQVVAVYGILMAGAAYLPLDPHLPEERLAFILEHSKVNIVCTQERLKEEVNLPEFVRSFFIDDMIAPVLTSRPVELKADVKPSDLAYVIFTSGSTGLPKGVMICHEGAVNTISDINSRFSVCPEDKAIAISNLNFDLSVYDIFGLLSSGGTVILPDPERQTDPAYWYALITKEKISLWNSVPAFMEMLVTFMAGRDEMLPESLRLILLSGDWIPVSLPDQIRALSPSCEIISLGGATEASIWSISYPVKEVQSDWPSIPYGKPLANQKIHVLDKFLNQLPDWVPGELFIGGKGVALGYLHDVEKTANSFIIHPRSGERLYRTGDIGCYLPDGNIRFMGRKDNQVKIRGHRIELGEIEENLKQHPDIRDAAVVVAQNHRQESYLSGFLILQKNGSADFVQKEKSDIFDLKEWDQLLGLGHKYIKEDYLKLPGSFHHSFKEYTDRVFVFHVLKIFARMGIDFFSGQKYSLSSIYALSQIDKKYEPLLSLWLSVLENEGILTTDKRKKYKIKDSAVVSFDLETSISEIKGGCSRGTQYLDHLDTFFDQVQEFLVPVLKGSTDPLETFFVNSLISPPDNLLNSLPAVKELNNITGKLMQTMCDIMRKGKKIHILEVGARSGQTTECLLNMLQKERIDYTVSDNSLFFTNICKEKFQSYDCVDYRILDMNMDFESQGFESHSMDIVIMSYSLHRAIDVMRTLEYTHRLLIPGGVLLVLEITGDNKLQLVSSAVLESFMNGDTDFSLMQAGQWLDTFKKAGFLSPSILPDPGNGLDMSGKHLFVSRTPSIRECFVPQKVGQYLKKKIPDYMVPDSFKLLEEFPLSANGKIDRKKLALSSRPVLRREEKKFSAGNRIQNDLLKIWEQVFKLSNIGITDNFFAIGGDSLLGTQLIARINKEMRVDISIQELFEAINIENLSEIIQGKQDVGLDLSHISTVTSGIVPDPENMFLPFPLTDVQQAYWLGRSRIFELGNVSTHSYFEIEDIALDVEKLDAALNRLIKQHPMMRAVILPDGLEQKILPVVPDYKMAVLDFSECDEMLCEKEVNKLRAEMSHQVLETDSWPLFDIKAMLLNDKKVRLFISFDNIIFDGWSMLFIFKEWFRLYNDQNAVLPVLDISFRDYVLAVEALKNTGQYKTDKEYWLRRLPEMPLRPELPVVLNNQSSLQISRFKRYQFRLSASQWKVLKRQAGKINVTPSCILLAAYAATLGAWSKGSSFSINLTLFNRFPLHPQVNSLVGDFTTLTLLAVDVSKGNNFAERASAIQKQLTEDLGHPCFGGVKVLRELARLHGDVNKTLMPVVFTSAIGLGSFGEDVSGISKMGKLVYNITQTPQVWLDHQVYEDSGDLVLVWDTVQGIFPGGLCQDMFDAYCLLVKTLIEKEDLIYDPGLSLLPDYMEKMYTQTNSTVSNVPGDLLHQLIITQAKERPEKIAVITEAEKLTYNELYKCSNQIAVRLREKNVVVNSLVAVVMEKGWEQIAGVLGVMEAGAAYLPIDPSLPLERICYLLENGRVSYVLTQKKYMDKIKWPGFVECIAVDAISYSQWEIQPIISLQKNTDLAYVIFTSGSTGMPKGVMIDHRGAVNTVLDINSRFGVNHDDCALALANLNFDLSVYDIFGILGAGGSLVVPCPDKAQDPAAWVELLNKYEISIWNSVPALLQALVDYREEMKIEILSKLRLTLLSGDWIPVNLPERIWAMKNDISVVSLGGATEASIWSIYYPVDFVDPGWKSIPYGYPLANQQMYVLAENMDPAPVWVPGKIYIGGIGLASGYWEDPQKTGESFVTNWRTGDRLYCTGDLGRYLPDGSIEFLGREDFQVKIRGYRIELGEIEFALENCKGVKQAVVDVCGADKGKAAQLVAYVVPEKNKSIEKSFLQEYLKNKLPGYMVPAEYIMLDSFPLTSNGKLDRGKLPAPENENQRKEKKYSAPENELEKRIEDLMTEILGVDRISRSSRFFDIGADSLHILKLQAKLMKSLDKDIPVIHLFEHTSIESLAGFLGVDAPEQKVLSVARQRAMKRKQKRRG